MIAMASIKAWAHSLVRKLSMTVGRPSSRSKTRTTSQ